MTAIVFCFSRDDIAYHGDISRKARDEKVLRRQWKMQRWGKKGVKLSTTQIELQELTLSHIKSNLYDYMHSAFNAP